MLNIAMFTGGIAATNGYACESNGDCFVVDAPEGMAAWLEAEGYTPQALLLTHAHFDHVLDAAAIQKRYQCPIYAQAHPTPELTLEALVESFGPSMKIAPYHVDRLLGEGDTLTAAGHQFAILEIPGHSPDSLTFQPQGAEVIFVGDVLMQGSVGRDDLPGGDGALLRRGIQDKLYPLDEALQVLPGHGEPTQIGVEKRHNPFVRGR